MWVMTNRGFYSAIQFDPRKASKEAPGWTKNVLLVRTRDEESVKRLAQAVGRDYHETKAGDYLYRIQVTRREFRTFLGDEVDRIGYGNFKSSVKNKPLHDAYMKVWSAMAALQPTRPWSGLPKRETSYPSRAPETLPGLWEGWNVWSKDDPAEDCKRCGMDLETDEEVEDGLCDSCFDYLSNTSVARMSTEDFNLWMDGAMS